MARSRRTPAGSGRWSAPTFASTKVDLADLGGFVGTTPGRLSTANQSAA